jgi:hypothetical protein
MAILKSDSYNGWKIVTGDDEFDTEMGSQLNVDSKELAKAINAENLTDTIFSRILVERSKAHQSLIDKIPGAGK